MPLIRAFDGSDADYAIMTAIDTAVFSRYPVALEEWQHIDATRDPKRLFRREMVLIEDRVIGFGEYGHSQWSFHPRRFFVHFLLHPDHEQPGVREFYLAHVLEALAPRQPISLRTGMLEDRTPYIRFFEEQGFEPVQREPLSELDLTRFDDARFATVRAGVETSGIRIITLPELAVIEPDWQRTLYDLEWEILQDVPHPERPTRPSFEHFVRTRLAGPGFLPEAYFVALDGDRVVGMSTLGRNIAKEDVMRTRLTGIVRSHRRRGIATALKLRAIEFARRHGARAIEAGNEEHNPMFELNQRLGFVAQPAWVVYEKALLDTGD